MNRVRRAGALLALTGSVAGCTASPEVVRVTDLASTPMAPCAQDTTDLTGLLSAQQALGTAPPVERSARAVILDAATCRPQASPVPTAAENLCEPDWQPAVVPDALAARGITRVAEATFSRGGTASIRQVRLDTARDRGGDVAQTIRDQLQACEAQVVADVNGQPELYRMQGGDTAVRVTPNAVDIVHRLTPQAPDPLGLIDDVPTG